MILNKEQIDLMSETDCERALKQMGRAHRLEVSWTKLTTEERDRCDSVGNTLLWLEDRIRQLKTSEQALQANQARWGDYTPAPKVERTGPKRKQFRIGDKIYADVQEASAKTGVQVRTLRTYVGRKPDMYAYVD